MDAKLYELTKAYNTIYEQIYDDEVDMQLIEEALNNIEGLFEEKAENIGKIIRSASVQASSIKAEEERLSKRRKSLENRCESLRAYLESQMLAAGKEKIKTPLFSFSIQNNPQSLKVTDTDILLKNYQYWTPQDPILDKKMLISDLKNGVIVPGAELQQTKSLRIR